MSENINMLTAESQVLVKRAFLLLEDRDFINANNALESALNKDPENAQAYLGKLLVSLKMNAIENLIDSPIRLDNDPNYQKALRFGDDALKEALITYAEKVDLRITAEESEKAKQTKALKIKCAIAFGVIAVMFIITIISCIKLFQAKFITPRNKYDQAVELYNAGNIDESIEIFREIPDYNDSRTYIISYTNELSKKISAKADHTVGVCEYGTVVATGTNFWGETDLSDWEEIVAVSVGSSHTVGLRSDGTVVTAGANHFGQCDTYFWEEIIAVSAGTDHTVGLRSDGTVVATGYNGDGQCDVYDWEDIVSVAAGWTHTVGLRSDGTVVATGINRYGECDVSDWKDIVAIAANNYHTIGLRSDGTVIATGNNEYGQCNVAYWEDIVSVAAGWTHVIGLRSDGTVVATGLNRYGECDTSFWIDIVAIAAGNEYTVGLREDGTVIGRGYNEIGERDVSAWDLFD